MFAFLICIVTLHEVHSACVLQDICPDNPTVQAEIVDRHNSLRRAVQPTASNMLIMSYNETIAASAQAWTEKCILGHGPASSRLLNGYQLGENLFYSSSQYTWTDIIDAWHSEVANYLYPKGSVNGDEIGHYTQVVWSSSYRVGCGVTLCPGNIYLYGCHYYRAGNFKGWPPYKAGAPCASCPNNCENNLCTNPCPYVNRYINCPSLKTTYGCGNGLVYAWCPAACKCTTEIIPIA